MILRRASAILPVFVLAAVSISPAVWNGFPLVFSDTGVYIGDFRYPGVPPFYGVFVAVSSLRVSLFLTVVVQALIFASVITSFLQHVGGVRNPWLLLVFGLAAALLNQSPWLVSWIMPDILTGAGIAAMSVLLFRQSRLEIYEYTFLLGVVLLAGLFATANLPFYAGYLAFSVAVRWVLVDRPTAMVGNLAVAAVLILTTVPVLSANLLLHGRAELNSASPTMNFSRLADIGLAQPVVRDACRNEKFAICDHLDALEKNVRGEQSFLWGGIADVTGSRYGTRGEYATLVSRIIQERWPGFLGEGLTDSGFLLVLPALENSPTSDDFKVPETWLNLKAYPVGSAPADWLAALYPASLEAYLDARQQHGEVLSVYPGTAYAFSTFLSYGVLVLMTGIACWRGDRIAVALGLAGLAAVVGHLVLHGVLVGPYPRYHAKIGWIGWVFVAVMLARYNADMASGSSNRPRTA